MLSLILLSACGIPSYPFLAQPQSGSATYPTLSFINNTETSSIFNGFVVYYRLYESGADASADVSAIGSLDPLADGDSTRKRLESRGFKPLEPRIEVDSSDYDEAFTVTIDLTDAWNVFAYSTVFSDQTLWRAGLETFAEISADDEDLKVLAEGSPEVEYLISAYVAAVGLDEVTLTGYFSQFLHLGITSTGVDRP